MSEFLSLISRSYCLYSLTPFYCLPKLNYSVQFSIKPTPNRLKVPTGLVGFFHALKASGIWPTRITWLQRTFTGNRTLEAGLDLPHDRWLFAKSWWQLQATRYRPEGLNFRVAGVATFRMSRKTELLRVQLQMIYPTTSHNKIPRRGCEAFCAFWIRRVTRQAINGYWGRLISVDRSWGQLRRPYE